MEKHRFEVNSEGVARDVKQEREASLLNRVKDAQNACGMKFDPEQPQYWDAMEEKLEQWPKDEIEELYYLHEIGTLENGETIHALSGYLLNTLKIKVQGKRVRTQRFSETLHRDKNPDEKKKEGEQ